MSEKQFEQLLTDIFKVKGFDFRWVKVSAWDGELWQPIETFQMFEEINDTTVKFSLIDVQVNYRGVPFQFRVLDFTCQVDDRKCSEPLFFEPDEFKFNSEEEPLVKLVRDATKDFKKRLSDVVDALLTLKS